jgi:hypothetical protein
LVVPWIYAGFPDETAGRGKTLTGHICHRLPTSKDLELNCCKNRFMSSPAQMQQSKIKKIISHPLKIKTV